MLGGALRTLTTASICVCRRVGPRCTSVRLFPKRRRGLENIAAGTAPGRCRASVAEWQVRTAQQHVGTGARGGDAQAGRGRRGPVGSVQQQGRGERGLVVGTSGCKLTTGPLGKKSSLLCSRADVVSTHQSVVAVPKSSLGMADRAPPPDTHKHTPRRTLQRGGPHTATTATRRRARAQRRWAAARCTRRRLAALLGAARKPR